MATAADTFALAFRHHQNGEFSHAERLYHEVIRLEPGHADSCHLLGALYFQAAQFENSILWFQRAVSLKPQAADFQSNLGLGLAAAGRLDEAVECFTRAIVLQPDLAATHSNLGNALAHLNRPADARQHYEQALKLQPANAEAHCGLGVIFIGENKLADAQSHLQEALRLNPAYAEAHNNLAGIFHRLAKPQEAIAHCAEALRLRPVFPEARLNMGNAFLLQENWREAETCFRTALVGRAEMSEAHCGLGHALERQDRLEESRESFEQAILHRPEYAEAHNGLGNVLARQEKLDQAQVCYLRAMKLKPRYAGAGNNLGCLLARKQHLAKAVATYRLALRYEPGFAEAHCNLGDALRQQNKFEEAMSACQEAIRLKPNYAAAHFNLGLIHAAVGNVAQAKTCFEQSLRLDPNSAETFAQLANLAMESSSFDMAVAHYERAVSLKPDFGEAHLNYAVVLAEQGRLDKAETHFQLAQRLWPGPKARIKHALVVPPVFQSVSELENWRRRFTEKLQQLHDEKVTLDVTNDPATTVFYLAYQGRNDRQLQEHVARLYVPPPEFSNRPPLPHKVGKGRIKVGFISHCFRNHSVGYWMRGLIANLSRNDFEVTVLSIGRFNDDIARFIRERSDQYLDVPRNLPASRKIIAEQDLDILIYTDIGMDAQSYTLALSRFAPIQCTTLGHPVSSGLATIDYYISCADLETEDSEECYTEKLSRLRSLPMYVYRPKRPPGINKRADFGIANDQHVYACLQSLFKFHPEFDEILGGILRRDPRGILFLSAVKMTAWEELLRQRFAKTLPDVMNRIRILPLMDYEVYLDLLSCADVQLDPIHFGGGNTSYDALNQGLPVVTMPSRFTRGRITQAFYKQMGVMECVARDREDYIQLALRLGNDSGFSKTIRDKILGANEALFENSAGKVELEEFLKQAVANFERD